MNSNFYSFKNFFFIYKPNVDYSGHKKNKNIVANFIIIYGHEYIRLVPD